MPRVKNSTTTIKKRRKLMKKVKGYEGGQKNLFRAAKQAATRAGHQAYTGRKQKKRDMRKMWNVRINAAARDNGLSYSEFIGLKRKKDVELNRKVLSEIAADKPEVFANIVNFVQQ
ncbi:MAG: 50S ribosomal protein L20 [Candidatus Paceibacteria bacterium]